MKKQQVSNTRRGEHFQGVFQAYLAEFLLKHSSGVIIEENIVFSGYLFIGFYENLILRRDLYYCRVYVVVVVLVS